MSEALGKEAESGSVASSPVSTTVPPTTSLPPPSSMDSNGSEENSPKLPALAAVAEAALIHAAGSSLSLFAAPWAPASPVVPQQPSLPW